MSSQQNEYPLTMTIDYKEKYSRVTTFFRIFLVIPILIILALLVQPAGFDNKDFEKIGEKPKIEKLGTINADFIKDSKLQIGVFKSENVKKYTPWAVGIIFLPTLLLLVFRRKYPKWWFNWNLEITRFSMRIFSYMIFLQDEYPSTDEEQSVHINIVYPDAKTDLSRLLPLIKWFLAIPHFIILSFLFIGLGFFTLFAWFSIIITCKYPKVFFDYCVGVLRWSLRVNAYCLLLVTDQYPPFSL